MTAVTLRGLENKNVLITGGAKGQGFNHAKAFAAAGANVAILDITEPVKDIYPLANPQMLASAEEQILAMGVHCIAASCDIRAEEQVAAAVGTVLGVFEAIDILVCNAGVIGLDPIHKMRGHVLDAVVDTIIKGHVYVAKYVTPSMVKRRSGKIINISSAVTAAGHGLISHYAAAKAGIEGLTLSWAFELAKFGINVNCVAPATIRPGEGQGSGMVLGLAATMNMSPEEAYEQFSQSDNLPGEKWRAEMSHITDAVLFLASENADQITGTVLRVDSGQSVK
jgi:(+)-trans-carveol dehydrogenase